MSWNAGILDEIRKSQKCGTYIDKIDIDRIKVTDILQDKRAGWVELSPGRHRYYYEIKLRHSLETIDIRGKKGSTDELYWANWGEINVKPHKVYVVIAYQNFEKVEDFRNSYKRPDPLEALQPKVVKLSLDMIHKIAYTPYHYEQTTGIATHPTVSKLSFKVK